MIQCNIKTSNNKLYQKKIKILQQQLKRRNIKNKYLKDLILRIKENVTSSDEVTQILEENFVFRKSKTIQYALLDRLNDELAHLEGMGIIQNTHISDWANPIVPIVKPGNSIRLFVYS